MARWFGAASIYCLPARYEPFGLSALEAALAGCALVLGDIPSLREVWGEAAVFVSPEHPDELAEALKALMARPQRLAEFAAKARRAASRYTPDRMASEYVAAYRQVLQNPRPATPPEVLAA